jgi:hypothetical protein
MSRTDLPSELALLGDRLEAAAQRTLERRRARQALLGRGVAVALGAPLALGVAAGNLAPGTGVPTPAHIRSTFSVSSQPPTSSFMVRHIPDEHGRPAWRPACPQARSCRVERPAPQPLTPGMRV